MFSKLAALTVAALVAFAVPASSAPASEFDVAALDKRLDLPPVLSTVYYCVDFDFKGWCDYSPIDITLNTCTNVPVDYNDVISSFKTVGLLADLGGQCRLYTDENCMGTDKLLTAPSSNLNDLGINDAISSYSCSVLGSS